MCDYSLEMYRIRPAVAGERYETRRFPSGSVGFVAPGDGSIAICMACDTRLELVGIPPALQQSLNVGETSAATFVRIEEGPYHDGVCFPNGAEITLQRLGPGVSASAIDTLTKAHMPKLRHDLELMTTR